MLDACSAPTDPFSVCFPAWSTYILLYCALHPDQLRSFPFHFRVVRCILAVIMPDWPPPGVFDMPASLCAVERHVLLVLPFLILSPGHRGRPSLLPFWPLRILPRPPPWHHSDSAIFGHSRYFSFVIYSIVVVFNSLYCHFAAVYTFSFASYGFILPFSLFFFLQRPLHQLYHRLWR